MNTILNATKQLTSEFSIAELFFGTQYIQHDFDDESFLKESTQCLDEYETEFYLYLSMIQSNVNKKSLDDFIKSSCIPPQWILGYQIESTSERNGYVLILDHSIKALCLYVNGTQSFTDLVTDLNAESTEFLDGFAHKGMMNISKWYVENMKPLISETLKDNENYNLYIIGHSLGAGVSSILSISLIEFFPNLKCIGFACPSCLSENLSKKCSNYVTSFINQNDFVPRFSIYTVKEMKKKLPSDWQVRFMEDVENTESNWMKGLRKTGAINYLLKTKKDEKSVKLPPPPVTPNSMQKLYPAGKIYHFFEIEKEVFIKPSKHEEFLDLILCGSYIEDHRMIHYFEKFEMLKLKLKKIKTSESWNEEEEKLRILKLLQESKLKIKQQEEEMKREVEKKKQEKIEKLMEEKYKEEGIKEEDLPPLPVLKGISTVTQRLPPIPTVKSSTSKETMNLSNTNIKLPPIPKK